MGLTERVRIPRLGKIHLGIKKLSQSGKEYPAATDYFVCDAPAFTSVYGEQPKTLDIRFPLEDPEQFASQYYKSYTRGRGLVCKGDGRLAWRQVFINGNNKEPASPENKPTTWIDYDCRGQECPIYAAGKCREQMMLQFMLPRVEGFGIWQIDTGSINSILNINNSVRLIQAIGGRVRMVPLTLSLVPQEVTAEGKKKTVHVLRLDIGVSLNELMESGKAFALPSHKDVQKELEADTEPPEDVDPDTGEIANTVEPPTATEMADGEEMAAQMAEPEDFPQEEPPVASPWPAGLEPYTEMPTGEGGRAIPLQQVVARVAQLEAECEQKAISHPKAPSGNAPVLEWANYAKLLGWLIKNAGK